MIECEVCRKAIVLGALAVTFLALTNPLCDECLHSVPQSPPAVEYIFPDSTPIVTVSGFDSSVFTGSVLGFDT